MNIETGKSRVGPLIRNVALIIIALGAVVFFFSLDLFDEKNQGGLFGPKMSSKLHFVGQVKSTEFSRDQLNRLSAFVNRYEKVLERVEIMVSKDDSYAELKPGTQVLFEVHMILVGGARLESPVRRTSWGKLVQDISRKMNKDLKAYAAMHGGRLKTKGGNILINSM